MAEVAGVDGCRGGWVVVTTTTDEGDAGRVERVSSLGPVIERMRSEDLVSVGLDMPIGLTTDGVRVSDREARRVLGPRRSSLFPTPPACVLDATDYPDALERCRAASGKGLSKQAFNLVPKMREVAALVTPELQPRISEVHPETSFAVMAGAPCRHSKRTPEGVLERLALLRPHFAGIDDTLVTRTVATRPDDVLDAFAAAWTARRMALGQARVLGDLDARDARGLRLTITA